MSPRDIAVAVLLAALGIGGAAMTQVASIVYPHHENLIFWIGCGLVAFAVIGIAALLLWPRRAGIERQAASPVVKIGRAEDSSFDRIEGDGTLLEIDTAKRVVATRLRSRRPKDE